MSWTSRQSSIERYWTESYVRMPVQSSELRQAIGLRWNLRPEDKRMSSKELGRRIDHCLVEHISFHLPYIEAEKVKVEEFEWGIQQIRQLMEEDMALMDFADTLNKHEGLRPASEVYIELARRRVLFGRRRPPSFDEGHCFARVMLDEILEEDLWQFDWDRETAIVLLGIYWVDCHDPQKRKNLMDESRRIPFVWDAHQRLCQAFAKSGETPPKDLVQWSYEANYGDLKRPKEGQPFPNRPRLFGYMLRDNEIRHTVDLLGQVGMTKKDAYVAVGNALDLSDRRVEGICREPYSTIKDIKDHAISRLDSLPSPRA